MYLTDPFPECLAFGAVRAPVFLTEVSETTAGFEKRNQSWLQVRHEFDVSFSVRTATDYTLLAQHFYKSRGRLNTFGVKDFLDFTVDVTEGVVLEMPDGTLQLHKRYGTGPNAYYRKITRPQAGTALFLNGGSPIGLTLNFDTGQVDGDSSTDPDDITWEGTFLVPARYDLDKLPSQVINRNGDELLVSVAGVNVVEVRE